MLLWGYCRVGHCAAAHLVDTHATGHPAACHRYAARHPGADVYPHAACTDRHPGADTHPVLPDCRSHGYPNRDAVADRDAHTSPHSDRHTAADQHAHFHFHTHAGTAYRRLYVNANSNRHLYVNANPNRHLYVNANSNRHLHPGASHRHAYRDDCYRNSNRGASHRYAHLNSDRDFHGGADRRAGFFLTASNVRRTLHSGGLIDTLAQYGYTVDCG